MAGRQAPKVLEGTRSPRSDRLDDMRAASEAPFDPTGDLETRPKVEGTVYISMYPGYMVQLSAPADIIDPVTGKKTVGRPIVARFFEGRYVNNARDDKRKYDGLTLREFIDRELQGKTAFGKPGNGAHYWLADEAVRMAQAAAKANATSTLRNLAKTNPSEFAQLVAELTQGVETDVVMPPAPGAQAE